MPTTPKKLVHRVVVPCVLVGALGFGGYVAASGGLGSSETNITGAGSTAAAPLFNIEGPAFNLGHPGTHASYTASGSGAGVLALKKGAADFAATDTPLTADELQSLGAVQFPILNSSVQPIINIPGVDHLRLDPVALTGIYDGTITKWNDPQIAALNPGEQLPNKDIVVFHRGDASGTNYAFSWYLATNAPGALAKIGTGPSPKLAGEGVSGTPAVAAAVQSHDYSIGYVEGGYASAGIPDKNQAELTVPSLTSTYVVVRTHGLTDAKRQALVSYFSQILSPEQQRVAVQAGFTPMTPAQLASATASANPTHLALLPVVPAGQGTPDEVAGQERFRCATPQFAGQSAATLSAFFAQPSTPGQTSWVRRVAGTYFDRCVEVSTPAGPDHAQIVTAAEDQLPPALATLLDQKGGIPLPAATPEQIARLTDDATAVAINAVNDVGQTQSAAKIASGGAGFVAAQAAAFIWPDAQGNYSIANNSTGLGASIDSPAVVRGVKDAAALNNPIVAVLAANNLGQPAIQLVTHDLSDVLGI